MVDVPRRCDSLTARSDRNSWAKGTWLRRSATGADRPEGRRHRADPVITSSGSPQNFLKTRDHAQALQAARTETAPVANRATAAHDHHWGVDPQRLMSSPGSGRSSLGVLRRRRGKRRWSSVRRGSSNRCRHTGRAPPRGRRRSTSTLGARPGLTNDPPDQVRFQLPDQPGTGRRQFNLAKVMARLSIQGFCRRSLTQSPSAVKFHQGCLPRSSQQQRQASGAGDGPPDPAR